MRLTPELNLLEYVHFQYSTHCLYSIFNVRAMKLTLGHNMPPRKYILDWNLKLLDWGKRYCNLKWGFGKRLVFAWWRSKHGSCLLPVGLPRLIIANKVHILAMILHSCIVCLIMLLVVICVLQNVYFFSSKILMLSMNESEAVGKSNFL